MFPYEARLKDVPIVTFDVETTGLQPGPDRVTEIAAARLDPKGGKSTFSHLVNPGRRIPKEVQDKTGITDAMVESKPIFGAIAEEFLNFIDGAVLVAHNSNFDVGFLTMELQIAGLKIPDNPTLDTLKISQKIEPNAISHRLESIRNRFFGYDEKQKFHRALGDAVVTMKIFRKMMDDTKSWNEQMRSVMKWAGGKYQISQSDLNLEPLIFSTMSLRGAVGKNVSIDHLDGKKQVNAVGKFLCFTLNTQRFERVIILDVGDSFQLIPIETVEAVEIKEG